MPFRMNRQPPGESNLGDTMAALDDIEGAYALKIQEYQAQIRVRKRNAMIVSGAQQQVNTVRVPDVIYRPRRAA